MKIQERGHFLETMSGRHDQEIPGLIPVIYNLHVVNHRNQETYSVIARTIHFLL